MDDRELTRVLKALGDLNRLRMLREIALAGELSCGQVAERFALSQPTVSHHLKVLADVGIVNVRQEAKHHFVSLNHEFVGRLPALLQERLSPARAANAPSGPVEKTPRPAQRRA